jgi:1-acyl-sn-glycerol-3-phosphate acyltransferase
MVFPRRVRYVITPKWYGKSAAWRFLFDAFGTLPAERGDPRRTIERVCAALGDGEVVGIFPEGRISRDGRMQRLRGGIGRIAAQSGAPVMPVGILGAYASLPRHRRLPRPRKVAIILGEPFGVPGAAPRDGLQRKGRVQIRDRLTRDICRLSGQEDRIPDLLHLPLQRSA